MAAIATYVFIDIGAPGLRKDNPDPIISLSLLAVRSEDFRNITDENREDRIIRPPIQSENYFHLRDEEFDPEEEIFTFLEDLAKPVCLIAFSAFNYDFPVIKSMLSRRGASFLEDITCADSMAAFFDIIFKPGDLQKTSRADRLLGSFPWPSSLYEKPSFGLPSVYKREMETTQYCTCVEGNLDDLKTASGRNLAALRVAVKFSDDFTMWVEKNCYRFAEVPVLKKENFYSHTLLTHTTGLLALTGLLWGCTNPFIRRGTRGLRDVRARSVPAQAWAELAFLLGNWRYVLPWLVNQLGSLAYLLAVRRAPLSLAVPAANGLAFAATAATGAAIGDHPLDRGSILGIVLIVAGTALCCWDQVD